MAASSFDGGATWARAVPLSQPGVWSGSPDLAGSEDGKALTAVWGLGDTDSGRRIMFAVSSDGGRNWSDPAPVGGGLRLGDPNIEVSADGMTAVVAGPWGTYGSDLPVTAVATHDGGKTWSPVAEFASSGAVEAEDLQYGAHLLSDDGGAVKMFYSALGTPQRESLMAASADHGWTWAPPEVLPVADAGLVSAAASSDASRLATAWVEWDARAGERRTFVLASRDGGRTWGGPTVTGVMDTGGDYTAANDSPLTMARDDWTALSLVALRRNALSSMLSSDGGRSWTAPREVASVGDEGRFSLTTPRLVGSDDGRMAVAVWGVESIKRETVLPPQWATSVDGGRTWSRPVDGRSLGLDGPASGVQVVMSGNGRRVLMVWSSSWRGAPSLSGFTGTFGSPPPDVRATPTRRATSLRVVVRPLVRSGQVWRFRVEERKSGAGWQPRTRVYRTNRELQSRTLDLAGGVYRVRVPAQHGHAPAVSKRATLRR